MAEPTTPTGKRPLSICAAGGVVHAVHPGLDYILAIEAEARRQERERLRAKAGGDLSAFLISLSAVERAMVRDFVDWLLTDRDPEP